MGDVKVAFLGLGSMGLPMARNLLEAGHKLTVYNRTRSRADGLERLGATIPSPPRGPPGEQTCSSPWWRTTPRSRRSCSAARSTP